MVRWLGGACSLAFGLGGCASPSAAPPQSAHGPQPAAASSPTMRGAGPALGQPCALSNPPSLGSASAPPRVFVEVAGVEGDLATIMRTLPLATDGAVPPQGFDALLHDPGIKRVSVHHVLAKNDTLETLLWDPLESAGKTQRVRWDMKLTPHVVRSSPVSVRLEVTLLSAPANGTPSDAPPADPTLAQTTVVLRDQQTIVLGGFGDAKPAPRTVFAVTPYVIWEEADIRRLYECKLRSRIATH